MRRKTIWIVGLVGSVCALGSMWALAQAPTVVTREAGHVLPTDAIPVVPEFGESVRDRIKLYPLPATAMHVVSNVPGGVAGGNEKLIYDNPEGDFVAEIPVNLLLADDINVAVEDGCDLRRYRFQIIGKAHERACGPVGTPCPPVTANFQLFEECPAAGGDAIPGTEGCASSDPARTDCIQIPSEELAEVNIFVPAGSVSLPSSVWLGISMSRSGGGVVVGAPALLGYSSDILDTIDFPCASSLGGFPRNAHSSFNASVYGDPACDDTCLSYQNIRADAAGVNPGVDVCIADDIILDRTCDMVEMEIGVRNRGLYRVELRQSFDNQPVGPCEGPTDFNQGSEIPGSYKIFLATKDGLTVRRFVFDTPIPLPSKNLFAVVSLNNVGAQWIMTRRDATIGESSATYLVRQDGVWEPTLPVDNSHGAMHFTITCADACPLGACCDQYVRDENNDAVCRDVAKINCPFPQKGSQLEPAWEQGVPCEVCTGGLRDGLGCTDNADCALGVCVGGPNDEFLCGTALDCGECNADPARTPCATNADCAGHGDGTCDGGSCETGTCGPNDPFRLPCGLSACCKPEGGCDNLTLNDCNFLLPLDKPRVWDLGQFCSLSGQRCPIPACLEAEGDCLTARPKICNGGPDDESTCLRDSDCAGLNDGVCSDVTPRCVGGDHNLEGCIDDLDCIPGGLCVSRMCDGGTRDGDRCEENRDCAESFCEGHPGCQDAFCCDDVCRFAPGPNLFTEFCCDVDWDFACAAIAQDICIGPPPNDFCAPGDRGESGAIEILVNGLSAQTNNTNATNEPGTAYCCNGGLSRCDGGCADGESCDAPDDCGGASDGYCNIQPSVPVVGLCTDGCNFNELCVSGDDDIFETICVGGINNDAPCMPRCDEGSMIGEGCASDADCPFDGACVGNTCQGGANNGQSCTGPADCEGDAQCNGELDCPGGLCDNSFCEGAPAGICADPVPEPGGAGFNSVWYYFTVPLEQGTDTVDIEVNTCGSNAPALDSMIQVYSIADSDQGICGDFGRCVDGSACSLAFQDCADGSSCFGVLQSCSVSAQDCPGEATCELDKAAACNTLSVIGCNDDAAEGCSANNSRLCLPNLKRGDTYYVVVSSKTEETLGTFRVVVRTATQDCPSEELVGTCEEDECVDGPNHGQACQNDGDCEAPLVPTNDYCADAIDLVDGDGDFTIVEPFWLDGATANCSEPPCNTNLENDVWYHLVSPVSGLMTATTCGDTPATSPDTEMMVYTGCECPPPLVPTPACATATSDLDCLTSATTEPLAVVEGECYTIRLGDNSGGGGSGNLTITFEQTCPGGTITAIDPLNGTVDAGYPEDPADGCVLAGTDTFTFSGPAGAADPACWSLCESAAVGAPNGILSVTEDAPGMYTVVLNRPMTPLACTSIIYDQAASNSSQTFIAHPADVGADGTSNAADVLDLIDVLNGAAAAYGDYSTDVDRSTATNAADVLGVIDLLNQAGCFSQSWNNVAFPGCGVCPNP